MKLHSSTNTVERSGDFEDSKYTIEASAKAFFILSDGLYPNKIRAVVRELSTNAYDSHVDANKAEVPFDVHLPTRIEPVFFVRDYGTSMSHEDCQSLYTTYFRSTRTNSNNTVGQLGLGSKSPYAYTNSFTVEAYLNGTRRAYTAYKHESGTPVFSLMDTSETSEPNGIKVSMNVKDQDIYKFKEEAESVYRFFNVKPNFIGGQKIAKADIDKVISGDTWYFDGNDISVKIIMGQIAYPLDRNALSHMPKNLRDFIEHANGLNIFVNIGDVDITPSREALSYSDQTKANLVSAITSIAEEITRKISEEINGQSTLYQARKKYVQISKTCYSIKSVMDTISKSITWNNEKLFDSIAGSSVNVVTGTGIDVMQKNSHRKKIDSTKDIDKLYFTDNVKFIVDDLNRGGISRIRQMMKDSDSTYDKQVNYIYKLSGGETVDRCLLYAILGGATKDDVVLTSSLPKVEYDRSSSSSSGGVIVQAQVFNEEMSRFEYCNMSVKYENAHYFEECKGIVKVGSIEMPKYNLEMALAFMHKNYYDVVGDARFYIVKPSVIQNRGLTGRDNWHEGSVMVKDIFTDAAQKHRNDILDHSYRQVLSKNGNNVFVEILKLTTTNSRAKQIAAEYHEYNNRIESVSEDISLIHNFAKKLTNFNTTVTEGHTYIKFANEFDEEMKKYPMLKVIRYLHNAEEKKIAADYIDSLNA
jgi:hypothetical protein